MKSSKMNIQNFQQMLNATNQSTSMTQVLRSLTKVQDKKKLNVTVPVEYASGWGWW